MLWIVSKFVYICMTGVYSRLIRRGRLIRLNRFQNIMIRKKVNTLCGRFKKEIRKFR